MLITSGQLEQLDAVTKDLIETVAAEFAALTPAWICSGTITENCLGQRMVQCLVIEFHVQCIRQPTPVVLQTRHCLLLTEVCWRVEVGRPCSNAFATLFRFASGRSHLPSGTHGGADCKADAPIGCIVFLRSPLARRRLEGAVS